MDTLLDKKGAAKMLGISLRTIERWMEERLLPYYKLPTGTIRFSKEKVEVWLKSREVQPAPVPYPRVNSR